MNEQIGIREWGNYFIGVLGGETERNERGGGKEREGEAGEKGIK